MSSEITTFLAPNSASPTIMAKGVYDGKPAYYKIFYNDVYPHRIKDISETALLYEAEIYRYISSQEENYKIYFINLLQSFSSTIQELVFKSIIKDPRDPILQKRMADLRILPDTKLFIIITEDTKSVSLNDFLKDYTDDYVSHNYLTLKTELCSVFELVLRGITVLNKKLNIQHNDMHFGNILIKKNTTFYPSSISPLESKYKISIYDFDRSYYFGHDNELLNLTCVTGNGCNTLSNKDLFVFVQSILWQIFSYVGNPKYSLYYRFLTELINAIIPIDEIPIFYKNMEEIRKKLKSLSWSAYCLHLSFPKYQIDLPCSKTDDQDRMLPWLNDIYTNFIQFSNDVRKSKNMFYYKKYLKYKNKYLSLKNFK